VEDWSERQSSSFVRDVRFPLHPFFLLDLTSLPSQVRIKGYHAVGSEGSGFVLFDIEIDTLSPNPASAVRFLPDRFPLFSCCADPLPTCRAPLSASTNATPPLSAYEQTLTTLFLASDLSSLDSHQNLLSVGPSSLPSPSSSSPFPPFDTAKYRPSFLERRRQHLAYWLSSVLLHPILGGCPEVRQWILEQ
jgi:hypothetical protein